VRLGGAPDSSIWLWVQQNGAVLLTKDEDFIELSRRQPGCAVVWFTTGNMPNRVLLEKLAVLFPQICKGLEDGEVLVVVE
jgi:predicted nuclease of predicted toxin-antitoxin system